MSNVVMTAYGRYEVVGRHLRECLGRLISCASVHYIHIVVWVSKMQILPFCLLRLEQHVFFRLAVSKMSTFIVRMGCPRIGEATAAFLHHSERFSHHTCQSAFLGKADRRTQFRRLCQSKSSRSRKPLTRASNVLSFVLIFDI